jgi:G3E family GTPase
MSGKTEGRLRLTLLGGFLGSGKTTWLRHQLHEGRFRNAYIIVNEAAAMPVDDALLGRSSRLSVLSGGCACCSGKVELIALLRQLCDERSKSAAQPFDEMVMETSGLADPAPIIEAIKADSMLVHHIVVGEIIVAVDALHGMSQLQREPLGRRQVEAADQLLITKIDEAGEAVARPLLATLKQINPGAELSCAAKGSPVPLPDFSDMAPEALPALHAATDRPAIFPAVLDIDDTIDWTALTVWLSALLHARGDDVLRVKGVLRTPAGRLLLQSVRKAMQSPEILPAQETGKGREDGKLVVIGSGYSADELRRSLRHFAQAGKN